jgi:predicted transposase/invertase (TIGR01784 family)
MTMAKKKKKNEEKKEFDPQVFMNIKTDYGFKRIFGSKVLLIAFLNALHLFSDTIIDLEYLPVEQLGYSDENRRAFYDVYAKTDIGLHFIVEMQICRQSYFAERMLYYASHSVVGQAPKGKQLVINEAGEQVEKEWDFNIDGVYTIAIVDFVMFHEEVAKDTVIENVGLMRKKVNIPFTNKFEFIIIELKKFKKTIDELTNPIEKWIHSIMHMEKLSECPDIMTNDIEFRTLYETARINKLSKEEMKTYKRSVLEYADVRDAMACEREDALKEGILIGEERGEKRGEKRGEERGKKLGAENTRIEVLKRLYKLNMSTDLITEVLGLTEEEIMRLLQNHDSRD